MPGPEIASQGMNSAGSTLYVGAWTLGVPVARPLSPQANWVPGMVLGQGSWVAIPEMIDGDGVDVKPSTTKLGHLRSPGKAEEKVPGRKDSNQWTSQFNYSAGLLASLTSLVPGAGTNPDTAANFWGRKSFVLELPDGGGWYFKAYLAGMPMRVPEDDRLTLSITLEIHGLPTQLALP